MSRIKCQCGYIYEDSFKFCPECAEPNPLLANPEISEEPADDVPVSQPAPAARKRFTRISSDGNSDNTGKSASVPDEDVSPAPLPERKPLRPARQEEYEEEAEETATPPARKPLRPVSDTRPRSQVLSAPSYTAEEEPEGEEYEYEDDYEEEYEEEYEEKPVRNSRASSLRPSPSRPKTSGSSYDPNHDGYYDDRLPAVLDEATKISHMDVILKIVLAVVGIAALIVYCIFYVNF